MKNTKVKAWGTRHAIWGRDLKETQWFRTKEERDAYYDAHNHIDKLRCRSVEEEVVERCEWVREERKAGNIGW